VTVVQPRRQALLQARRDLTRALEDRLVRDRLAVAHARAQVTALSPGATLARGYAVVQRADGAVVRSPADAAVGERLRLRLATGEIAAVVDEPAT